MFALTVTLVAKAAVPVRSPVTFPVNGPAKASDVTVPSKNASLNSKELVPKSISSSVVGFNTPSTNTICSVPLISNHIVSSSEPSST